ncbi:putative Rho guanine nucleotide exchange factor [Histomonas meleagridis]|uniref:putative Rho guanine nucleotide exchange factor n=1 Tax=Histomonas meleagridis TaxID=135588 RepID=UPI00355A620B|nr:putative Rho guanine nucleotide exchange factor [Histomonas meleagridis]KAH0804252.1 putative Rho guanine nucleotide exchange factor [Histomonas meleagridis]
MNGSPRSRSLSQLVSTSYKTQPKKNFAMLSCYLDLCYCPISQIEKKEPPFPLLIDKKKFISGQIPGLNPNETKYVDALEFNSLTVSVMISIISNERKFIHDISLLIRIISSLDGTNFSPLYGGFYSILNEILSKHEPYLKKLENLIKNRNSLFLADFVESFTNCSPLIQSHQKYIIQYLHYENLTMDLSANCPEEIQNQIDDVLIHYFKLPIQWHQFISKTTRTLSNVLPLYTNPQIRSTLIKYAKYNSDLYASTDSIPKLEEISRMFLREPLPIVVPGRRVIRIGKASKQCRKSISERDIILFSDFFLYVQVKGGMYVMPGIYDLLHLRVESKGHNKTYALFFFSPMKSFILYFNTSNERDQWEADINEAIKNIREHQIIKKYKEAPIWTPDCLINECCNCHHPLSFFTRKHHCRSCGKIFCSDCLSHKVIMKNISNEPCKVCDQCFKRINKQKIVSIYRTNPEEDELESDEEEDEAPKLFSGLNLEQLPSTYHTHSSSETSEEEENKENEHSESDNENENENENDDNAFDIQKLWPIPPSLMEVSNRQRASCSLPNFNDTRKLS